MSRARQLHRVGLPVVACLLPCLIGCASPGGQKPSGPVSDAAPSGGDAGDPFQPFPDAPSGDGSDATPTPSGGPHIELALPANVAFTDTGADVTRGALVSVIVSGEIVFGPGAGETTTPDGSLDIVYAQHNVVAPVRHAAVIGRIGPDGPLFRVGSSVAFYAPIAGRLYLGVNDVNLGGNSGSFAATIDVGPVGTVPVVAPRTASVTVSGTAPWADAGVDLVTFAPVSFSATGTFNVAPTVPVNAGGTPNPDARVFNILPGPNHGVLLARIGVSGTPFAVGTSLSLVAPYAGRLYLCVNDIDLTNNSGSLATSITVTP